MDQGADADGCGRGTERQARSRETGERGCRPRVAWCVRVCACVWDMCDMCEIVCVVPLNNRPPFHIIIIALPRRPWWWECCAWTVRETLEASRVGRVRSSRPPPDNKKRHSFIVVRVGDRPRSNQPDSRPVSPVCLDEQSRISHTYMQYRIHEA